METRKLYYEDSHMYQFAASVLSCTGTEKGYEITLDTTAFYPEGGGQAADTGTLGGVRVLDTREREGQVIHICDAPLTVGEKVEGAIDEAPRFLRMQQHSGEHIVSGIIYRRYGYHNTGFHMGADTITIDFDGVIPAEELASIEAEANSAVWQNLPIRCWYPSPEELPTITYRTKRALPWPVRIVEIPGFDTCACCGTHVKATGEIGLIKLFSVMGFRGGTRMEMACGRRALEILNTAYEQNRQVSNTFSAKMAETGEAAARISEQLGQQKFKISQLEKQIFKSIAAGFVGQGDILYFADDLDNTGIRELADAIADTCGGTAAVFCGSDEEGYAFCLVTREGDLREQTKAMTKALDGRGGGKPNFQQGRVRGTKAQIREYFAGK